MPDWLFLTFVCVATALFICLAMAFINWYCDRSAVSFSTTEVQKNSKSKSGTANRMQPSRQKSERKAFNNHKDEDSSKSTEYNMELDRTVKEEKQEVANIMEHKDLCKDHKETEHLPVGLDIKELSGEVTHHSEKHHFEVPASENSAVVQEPIPLGHVTQEKVATCHSYRRGDVNHKVHYGSHLHSDSETLLKPRKYQVIVLQPQQHTTYRNRKGSESKNTGAVARAFKKFFKWMRALVCCHCPSVDSD